MIDICQEADIKFFEFIFGATELLEELLIGRNNFEVFFVFEETS